MRKAMWSFVFAIAGLAMAGQLWAGGLWVQLGNPKASAEAKAVNAAVTVLMAGCHDPASAQITATAIGMVNGRQKTIELKLTPLKEPGFYAVTRQWPSDGRWVLQFVARVGNGVTSTLVAAGPDGVHRNRAKMAMALPNPEDITSILNGNEPQSMARR